MVLARYTRTVVGKHKTTGFNGQAIANLRGDLLFVSEPVTGHNHDMTALAETETADIIAAAYSGIGDKGYQGSDFITPFKKLARRGVVLTGRKNSTPR